MIFIMASGGGGCIPFPAVKVAVIFLFSLHIVEFLWWCIQYLVGFSVEYCDLSLPIDIARAMDRPSLVFDAAIVRRTWLIALTCWLLSGLTVRVMTGNGNWVFVARQCMIAASRPLLLPPLPLPLLHVLLF